MDPESGHPADPAADAPGLPAAALRGAIAGAALLVPVVAVTALVDSSSPDEVSPWRIPLFFAVLAAFGTGGWIAGRCAPDVRLSAGLMAGLGAFALWIPLRTLAWWVRDDGRGLVTGADAVLGPGQVFTAALFAATIGLVGGLIGGRR